MIASLKRPFWVVVLDVEASNGERKANGGKDCFEAEIGRSEQIDWLVARGPGVADAFRAISVTQALSQGIE